MLPLSRIQLSSLSRLTQAKHEAPASRPALQAAPRPQASRLVTRAEAPRFERSSEYQNQVIKLVSEALNESNWRRQAPDVAQQAAHEAAVAELAVRLRELRDDFRMPAGWTRSTLLGGEGFDAKAFWQQQEAALKTGGIDLERAHPPAVWRARALEALNRQDATMAREAYGQGLAFCGTVEAALAWAAEVDARCPAARLDAFERAWGLAAGQPGAPARVARAMSALVSASPDPALAERAASAWAAVVPACATHEEAMALLASAQGEPRLPKPAILARALELARSTAELEAVLLASATLGTAEAQPLVQSAFSRMAEPGAIARMMDRANNPLVTAAGLRRLLELGDDQAVLQAVKRAAGSGAAEAGLYEQAIGQLRSREGLTQLGRLVTARAEATNQWPLWELASAAYVKAGEGSGSWADLRSLIDELPPGLRLPRHALLMRALGLAPGPEQVKSLLEEAGMIYAEADRERFARAAFNRLDDLGAISELCRRTDLPAVREAGARRAVELAKDEAGALAALAVARELDKAEPALTLLQTLRPMLESRTARARLGEAAAELASKSEHWPLWELASTAYLGAVASCETYDEVLALWAELNPKSTLPRFGMLMRALDLARTPEAVQRLMPEADRIYGADHRAAFMAAAEAKLAELRRAT